MNRRIIAIALASAALAPSAAQATTVRLFNLPELVDRASHIVSGEVVSGEAEWMGKLLVTKVRLRVTECLKGTCGTETVDVAVLGGELDGVAMMVDGAARFYTGEHVVLFLRGSGGGAYQTVGMAQGKFVRAGHDDDAPVVRDLSGLAFRRDGIVAEHVHDPFQGLKFRDLRAQVHAVAPSRMAPGATETRVARAD